MTSFFKAKCQDSGDATTRAEVMFCYFVAEHNLADHFNDLGREMFPNSEIAKKFKCKWTKTSQIVKRWLAKAGTSPIIERCRKGPYSLNDKAAQTRLLDMPICSDGSAQGIFNIIDGVLRLRPASGWHPTAHASGCNLTRLHRAGTTGRHPAVGSTAVGGPAFASIVCRGRACQHHPITTKVESSTAADTIDITYHIATPFRTASLTLPAAKACQQSDYNNLVEAETAKARDHIQKLKFQCKVLEKKDKIADLKIALLTRKLEACQLPKVELRNHVEWFLKDYP